MPVVSNIEKNPSNNSGLNLHTIDSLFFGMIWFDFLQYEFNLIIQLSQAKKEVGI